MHRDVQQGIWFPGKQCYTRDCRTDKWLDAEQRRSRTGFLPSIGQISTRIGKNQRMIRNTAAASHASRKNWNLPLTI
jgi:hypothetical protein